ncbi:MAG TPA: hypothetical protein VN688_16755 [Gemmataceae bacterium]|nr:hypothetical protein [Gemmataceae bacterium]
MRIRLVRCVLLAVLLCTSVEARAQNLPPPRVLPPETRLVQPVMPPAFHPLPPNFHPLPPYGRPLPLMYLPPVPYRPSAYQHWQYYGITYSGNLRPRVIQMPRGGYFLYNGYPFPYVHVYPGEHFNPIGRD